MVWVLMNGTYTKFDLIETRFCGKELAAIQEMQSTQRGLVKEATQNNLQAKISLAEHISTIASNADALEAPAQKLSAKIGSVNNENNIKIL